MGLTWAVEGVAQSSPYSQDVGPPCQNVEHRGSVQRSRSEQVTNAPSDIRGFGHPQDRSVFVAYVLQPGAGHTSHVHSCACTLANRTRCRGCKRKVFFRCLAACCGPLLADDVYPREPGDRNAMIVAFVRDCRSEATTRRGTSCGTGRQGRSFHAGRVGVRVGSAGPVNESCVPAETGYAHRRGGILTAGFLPSAVSLQGLGRRRVSRARSATTILSGRLHRRWTQHSLSTARLRSPRRRPACTSNGMCR